MSRFIPAAVLGSALLGLVTLGFQLERVSAQCKAESAQHQAISQRFSRFRRTLSGRPD